MHNKKLINSYAVVIAKQIDAYIKSSNTDGDSKELEKDLINQLQDARSVINGDMVIFNALTSPLTDKVNKDRFLAIIVDKLTLNSIIAKSLSVIASNNRINLLNDIIDASIRILAEQDQITFIYIVSAKELTHMDQAALKEYLEKLVDTQTKIHYEVEASLIGGLVIQYNDQVIDCSIKGALKKISKSAFATIL